MEKELGRDGLGHRGAEPLDGEERRRQLVRWMREYGEAVLHLAYFYVRDRDVAEDVFQDVFLRVYAEMDRLRDERAVRTCAFACTEPDGG